MDRIVTLQVATREMNRSIFRSRSAGYIAAILGIAAVTGISALHLSYINETTVALGMLLVVFFVAAAWNSRPAVFASIAGVVCLYYFVVPPRYGYAIVDPEDWIVLAAFLIIALTAGRLSAWAKQQAAEAEASRSQARLASVYNRSLLEASLEPVMTVGHDGKINDANEAAEMATGRSRGDLIGASFAELFTTTERAGRALEGVLRRGFQRGYSLELRHRLGHSISVLCDASLYRDAAGNVVGVVVTAHPVRTYVGKAWEAQPDARVVRHLRLFVSLASLFTAAVGVLSIVGIVLGIPLLKSALPGRPVITMNTAVCLVLLGFCLWTVRKAEGQGGILRFCGRVAACIVALAGLLSLAEYVTGWRSGVDELLYRQPAADAAFALRPGLISPITAGSFLLLGIAFLILDRPVCWKGRHYWPAQHLAAVTGALAIAGFLDFILGSRVLGARIALQTVVGVVVISLGVMCTRTDRGLAQLLASSTEGGTLTRRLLPAAILIPILIGALSWRALLEHRYTEASSVSLMTSAMIALLGALVVWNGYLVNRGDVERRKTEAALHRNEIELREAQRLAQLGSWWWDPKSDQVVWSRGLFHLTMRDPSLPPPTYQEHLGAFTPESAARLAAAIRTTIRGGASFQRELEIVRQDGAIRSVAARGEVERNARGEPVVVRGTIEDITERKRAQDALQRSAEEIRDLYNHAPCGYHSLDRDGVFVRINDTELEWLQYSREEVVGKFRFTDLLNPEGQRAFEKNFSLLIARGAIEDLEYDLIRKDGTTFQVLVRASALTDANGNFLMTRSMLYDITSRKRAETEIRQLALQQSAVADLGQLALRSDPFGKVLEEAVIRAARVLNVDYARVLELDPSGERLVLRSSVGWNAEVAGTPLSASPETEAGFTLSSKEPVIAEDFHTETRFHRVAAFGEPDVVSGISVVITTAEGPYGVLGVHTRERRTFTNDEVNFLQAVANVLGIMIERRRAEAALLQSNRAHRALSNCNEVLIRATDETSLLEQICQLIVEEAGYRFCWVGHAEQDEAKTVRPLAKAGFEAGYLDALNLTWADSERGRGQTGASIRTGHSQLIKNYATDPRVLTWRADALKRGYASSLAIPLMVDGGKTFGALTIYSGDTEAFGAEEVALLTELASDLGYGITALHMRAERLRAEEEIRTLNAQLEQRVIHRTAQLQAANKQLEQAREREIEIGFRIQQTLLLDRPPDDFPGLRVAAMTIPSQRIDGDFYIFIRQSEECLDVIVGDVMGKGIPAALLGAATKSSFLRAVSDLKTLSKDGAPPEPKDIVMLAHAELAPHLIELDSFVTLVYARFDESRRKITLVDCGHTGVVHWHSKTGRCNVLRGENLPLGVREGEIYDQVSSALEPQDLVLFFSDGITEARNSARELFGIERLEEFVCANGRLAPEALVERIRRAVVAFSGADRLTDDLTIVAIRMEERQLPAARAEIELDSDLSDLRQAREFVRGFCGNLPGTPIDQDSELALELAVNEAASNIIKHAYHGRANQRIHLEAEAFPSHISIRLHHFGDPFDPSSTPPPRLNGSRDSGFGVYIINQSVDEVHYGRDSHGRNCVALKKFKRSKTNGKEASPHGDSCG